MHNPFPEHIIVGSLCYVLHDHQVLLLKRARPPHVGYWTPPGGKAEHGESPQECCIREMKEETGLTIADPVLRCIQTVVDVAYPVHWLLFIFRADHPQGTLHPKATSEGELRWIALADLAHYERPHTDQQHWTHIINERPGVWQGKIVYDQPATRLSEVLYGEA